MDVALVSPRSAHPNPQSTRDFVSALASDLVSVANRVRWIRPRLLGEPEVELPGVQVVDVPTRRVPFRAVVRQLSDLSTERVLSQSFRAAPPDVVHVHGFGGASSYLCPWLADRLGVPAVVVAAPVAESLCHRRTLVDARQRACREWESPDRCADCCRTASTDGLGRVASIVATLLRPLGARSPFPSPIDFTNRLDMIAQGLGSARVVCVADADAADALVRIGVPKRVLRIGVPAAHAAEWLEIYRFARGSGRG